MTRSSGEARGAGPAAAIVIATHRRPELLRRTLGSLADSRADEIREVLVVENGGAHGAKAVVGEFTDSLPLRYLFLPEGNKCRALNLALRESTAELVVFFDDDVRVADGTVETYLNAARRYGSGHYFSGPLVPELEIEPPDWLKPYLPASATGWSQGDAEVYYDRPWFIGSNWAAFHDDMLAVGGFDERIGPGSPTGAIGDESELQQRMLEAGSRGVYLPDARVRHHVPPSECSFEWARSRMHRTGLTYGVLGWTPQEGPIPDGLAGWARLAVLSAKVVTARLLGWSEERRCWLEMTRARTLGYLRGRRVTGRLSRLPSSGRGLLDD